MEFDGGMARLLLVQMRTDEMKHHERNCFIRHMGLEDAQLRTLDVFCDALEPCVLDDVDGLIIGGAGEFRVSDRDLPTLDALIALVREARVRSLPTLGACYGAHVLTVAFGGEVVYDEARMQFGTYRVTQNECARACPVFGQLPVSYDAQFGHKDHVSILPSGAVNMASTELSSLQAWTFPGEPIYAVQLHAELDEEGVLHRMRHYADVYHIDDEELSRRTAAIRPSPEAPTMLKHFLEQVVEGKKTYPMLAVHARETA